MRCAGGDNQKVKGKFSSPCLDRAGLSVDPGHFGHEYGDIFLSAQNMPDRPGDVGGGKRCGCDLIQQRLKAVIVIAVDDGDLDGLTAQSFCRLEAAEAGAKDDNSATLLGHGPAQLCEQYAGSTTCRTASGILRCELVRTVRKIGRTP